MKKIFVWIICAVLLLGMTRPALAAEEISEPALAAEEISEPVSEEEISEADVKQESEEPIEIDKNEAIVEKNGETEQIKETDTVVESANTAEEKQAVEEEDGGEEEHLIEETSAEEELIEVGLEEEEDSDETIVETEDSSEGLVETFASEGLPVTSIKLDKSQIEIPAKKTVQLIPSFTPVTPRNANVIWKSSNTKIAKVDDNGNVTALSMGKAVITATTEEGGYSASCNIDVLFSDVTNKKLAAYKAIYWGTEKGIVAGYGSYFDINAECTRGQVVMFLWRTAGKPKPSSRYPDFIDVSSDHPYAKAICWANEKGFAKGFSDNTFRPDEPCTRGQIVTFMWRYKGQPDAKSTAKSFPDVSSKHKYYKSIMWASGDGITTGFSDGKFRPDETCTRGQCVTFLYRMVNKFGSSYKVVYDSMYCCTEWNKTHPVKITSTILAKGTEMSFICITNPALDKSSKISWTSSNTSVATVTANGTVKGLKKGTVTITAKTEKGKTAKIIVKVDDYAYMADNDAKRIQNTYSSAQIKRKTVYAYTSREGEDIVLTRVEYEIRSSYADDFLHSLTKGTWTDDPDSYYDYRINTATGKHKLELYSLPIEVLDRLNHMLKQLQ